MSVRAALVPQLFTATTDSVQVTNPEGKLMLTALRLFGPLTDAPPVAVHRYDVACATGITEYDTPLCAHCPLTGPEMLPGIFGMPFAMLLQRCALALPQLLTAVTHTVDPAGITAGKSMDAEFEVGEITAPGTEVVQL